MKSTSSLTDLESAAPERSARLSALIETTINNSGERAIGFDEFMQMALYAPELGYYVADNPVFGSDGDFVTAPESGALFARCLAGQAAQVLRQSGGAILEYGAGSGQLAADLVPALLDETGQTIDAYHIIEPSPTLRTRQRTRLAAALEARGVAVYWHATPPENFCGLVIANEVLDALPARRYVVEQAQVRELAVTCRDGAFAWTTRPQSDLPQALVETLCANGDGYITEVHHGIAEWLELLAAGLSQGVVLIADYGYPRHEYLHPSRAAGTLKAHYRHQVHDDPFYLPGLQDLTVSVDFTSLAERAEHAGFSVLGYAAMNRFLLGAGLERCMADAMSGDAAADYSLAQEAKRLLLPGEMGQTFKVMALARGDMTAPSGFADDERYRLSAVGGASPA